MLMEKMYVRCPADKESLSDPRIFVCGQITKVDSFKKTVCVKIFDPFSYLCFFEDLPRGEIEIPESLVQRCTFFLGTFVFVKNHQCTVLSYSKAKDGYYYYYLQDKDTKEVFQQSEKNIVAAFNNGRVDPAGQLKRYEFQNPCWFFGHSIVSKSMNVLDNSIYGFKELAGSKIYLLPHQVNSIMRCLQEEPCRYMLADEVGMGKTIEAISVLKIYMHDRSNKKALIIVPEALKEQWKTELFLKFNIEPGEDENHNNIAVKSIGDLNRLDVGTNWDFVIIDEVHKYLAEEGQYDTLHRISHITRNILLLSATPVQQRKEEYLSLLRLLLPDKYDLISIEQFSKLVEKQSNIIQKTTLILDDLSDYDEEIDEVRSDKEDPHESDDCRDLFKEIQYGMKEICDDLNDERLNELFERIKFEDDDLGTYAIKVIISYICSNYQIESRIIRNRRKLLETADNDAKLLPTRQLQTVTYELDNDKNTYETLTYELLSNWIIEKTKEDRNCVETDIRPLLSAFFSSPWAFSKEARSAEKRGTHLNRELMTNAERWTSYEQNIVDHIVDVIDDPVKYEEYYSTRLVTVLNTVYEELYDQKIVLFTNYKDTFDIYRTALSKLLPAEEVSFFGEGMDKNELELNAYRFQNGHACRLMLCDSTGGEGRNFQCADYIFHIDLPWDANMIEQRIGRLDRLERDPARPIVHSIVVYAQDSFEEALFKFWNEGLKIFTQSLSGMEIIMNDINNEIITAIQRDFKVGLFDKIPNIIELANNMRTTVRKEQNFDAAGFIYRPMYNELKRLIDFYTQHENELFANTMTNWASLAGFHGHVNKEGVVTYSAHSFSPKSAINVMLIPPRWNDYIHSAQNLFANRVRKEYNKSKPVENIEGTIRGTFIRKQAIVNDYLHFFAPGDAVFDCIVDNAMHSCKGQVSAFAFPSTIDWTGLVFTWSLSPDIDYLISNGVSIYALGSYRNYLMSEQVITPFTIQNDDEIDDSQVIHEYTRLIEMGIKPQNVVHLGKRTNSSGFLKEQVRGTSNINWFRKEYPKESWDELVDSARKESSEKARDVFKRRSNIRGAREEMERTLSAKAANAEYFGISDQGLEELKRIQDIILNAIKQPKLILESAAFVWMVKRNDE
ncbi:SNF2-related protein [Porcincola intestinalis]|uniref:SNF2-related protein n=1 Tax=Porcincola intestinalis TaxID=2606632 RepID=UPI002A919FBA|nr:SNF2-related protein [Porcincola intestinalis]MDY5579549.1 SNF2-related protein [Porcincola intestinalis]